MIKQSIIQAVIRAITHPRVLGQPPCERCGGRDWKAHGLSYFQCRSCGMWYDALMKEFSRPLTEIYPVIYGTLSGKGASDADTEGTTE